MIILKPYISLLCSCWPFTTDQGNTVGKGKATPMCVSQCLQRKKELQVFTDASLEIVTYEASTPTVTLSSLNMLTAHL